MKSKEKLSALALCVILVWGFLGCSNREAAQVGAMIGRRAAIPLGTAVVAIEETINTVGDIQAANPRKDHQPKSHGRAARHDPPDPGHRTPLDQEPHFFKSEVFIKTVGPANIESIEVGDPEEVSEFWK